MNTKRCYVATTVLNHSHKCPSSWLVLPPPSPLVLLFSPLLSCPPSYVLPPSLPTRLLALGGHDGNTRLASAEIYDPGELKTAINCENSLHTAQCTQH